MLTDAVKVSVLGVCVSPGYSYVVFLYGWHVFSSRFFNQLLLCRLLLVTGHTGIPGLWTQELDAGLWMLDSWRWTLDAGP